MPKKDRLAHINQAIQNLQAKKEKIIDQRLQSLGKALKKSQALHLPDALIVGVLQHTASLYAKNPSDPFLLECLPQQKKPKRGEV